MKEILVYITPILPVLLLVLFFSKKQKPWSELSQKERKNKVIVIIAGILLFVSGMIIAFLY